MSNVISKLLIQIVSLSRQHLHFHSLTFLVYHIYHCLSFACSVNFPVRELLLNSIDMHEVEC